MPVVGAAVVWIALDPQPSPSAVERLDETGPSARSSPLAAEAAESEVGAPPPEFPGLAAFDGPPYDPTQMPVDFLPFPNEGEADFSKKYDHLDTAILHALLTPLNQIASEVVAEEASRRFDSGLFTVQGQEGQEFGRMSADELAAADPYPDQPRGLGRVWPSSRVVGWDAGFPEVQVTYLTEVEYPHVFALQDEYLYVAKLWSRKNQATLEGLNTAR